MKICIETYGCALNKADSKAIEAQLADFELVNYAKADIVILNSCGVKNCSESRTVSRIEKCLSDGKKVIVAGCMPKINKNLIERYPVAVVDLNSYDKLKEAVKNIDKSPRFYSNIQKKNFPELAEFENEVVVPISKGCLGACNFCTTKNARGNLTSYQMKDIIDYIKNQVEKGKKRILLTSQDTGCYGRDIGTNLVELLKKIVELDNDFTIRVGMMNPKFCYEMLDELIEVFKNSKIEKFVHVPVQSGSNKVLREMNRPYAVDIFEKILKAFRKEIPDIYVVTDIIVGFPTETDSDFEETLGLIQRIKPDKINSSKFYPRPHTKAKEMPQLSTQIKKQRSVKLAGLLNSFK